MAESNRNAGRAEAIIKRERHFDGTIFYLGTREALISAGVLRDEWIPLVVRPGRRHGSVRTELPNGTAVRVYRRGDKLEVWHEPTEAEMEANREAYHCERRQLDEQREREALRYYHRRAPLLAALEARYPGVQVADISFRVFEEGDVQQSVRFLGPIEILCRYGLVTEGMMNSLNERSNPHTTTPLGDGFSLFDHPIDSRGRPGQWDLSVHTGSVPRGRERIAVKDATRLLRRFMLPRRRGRPAKVLPSGGAT